MKHVFTPSLGEEQILRELRQRAPRGHGLRARVAHELGISQAHLSNIMNRRRPVPDGVAGKLGFHKVSRWERSQ